METRPSTTQQHGIAIARLGRLAISSISVGALTGVLILLLSVGSAPAGAETIPDIQAPAVPAPRVPEPDPRLTEDRSNADNTDDPRIGDDSSTGSGDDDSGQGNDGLVSIDIGGPEGSGAQTVLLVVGLGLISIAPTLVLMLSSFTRIVIVFSLTRNALGLQGIPPNQVLVGLALFLSLFIMAPTIETLNAEAIGPYMANEIDQEEALERARGPVREFMLEHTEPEELEVMMDASRQPAPGNADEIPMTVLIPAFVLSELKTAFIIGFVIFIPFLIIDIVVAASLMALGMMMLPPAFISLPFKLLLFIIVGGWSLIVETLLASYL